MEDFKNLNQKITSEKAKEKEQMVTLLIVK